MLLFVLSVINVVLNVLILLAILNAIETTAKYKNGTRLYHHIILMIRLSPYTIVQY